MKRKIILSFVCILLLVASCKTPETQVAEEPDVPAQQPASWSPPSATATVMTDEQWSELMRSAESKKTEQDSAPVSETPMSEDAEDPEDTEPVVIPVEEEPEYVPEPENAGTPETEEEDQGIMILPDMDTSVRIDMEPEPASELPELEDYVLAGEEQPSWAWLTSAETEPVPTTSIDEVIASGPVVVEGSGAIVEDVNPDIITQRAREYEDLARQMEYPSFADRLISWAKTNLLWLEVGFLIVVAIIVLAVVISRIGKRRRSSPAEVSDDNDSEEVDMTPGTPLYFSSVTKGAPEDDVSDAGTEASQDPDIPSDPEGAEGAEEYGDGGSEPYAELPEEDELEEWDGM